MRIFLIGFMGAGKTTIGKSLAAKLEMQLIDLDHYIVQKEGRSIAEIFAQDGEETFRKIEKNALVEVALKDNVVVSTGGGTPCWGNNMEIIKEKGISIYLKCEAGMLVQRLMQSYNKRPLIEGMSEEQLRQYVERTLMDREKYYNQASVIIADPSRNVTQILNVLSYYKN